MIVRLLTFPPAPFSSRQSAGAGEDAQEGPSSFEFLNKHPPSLRITVRGVTGLRPGAADRVGRSASDPRVTISWGGATLSTSSASATQAPVFGDTLSFALPALAGRNVHARRVERLEDLEEPLSTLRHALVQVGFPSVPSAGG
jgi:hypothetical protein